MLGHFEETIALFHLDEELHRQVGEAAGIVELYDMLGGLPLATTELG